ncbi:MAG TPA: hypothetical protein VLI69_03600 [Gammaproteobacteria bacterium]|nr:hypothetical protein [Gammaproteobacteria bacterium]
MKNLFNHFAISLISLAILLPASHAYAACTPVLAVIRHAEDANGTLDKYGNLHAKAYSSLFVNVKNKLDEYLGEDICLFTKILSLQTTNPELTAAPIAKEAHLTVQTNPKVFLPALDKDSSTLLVLNRQTIWGNAQNAPSNDSFLGKVAGNNTEVKNVLKYAQSPRFNYLYIFTNQNPSNNTFNHAAVYIQLYNTTLGKNLCRGRLKEVDFKKGEVESVNISSLAKFPNTPSGHAEITSQLTCAWSD